MPFKEAFLLTVHKTREGAVLHHAMQVYMGKCPGWSGGRRSRGESMAQNFTLVSLRRNGQGKVGKFEQVWH